MDAGGAAAELPAGPRLPSVGGRAIVGAPAVGGLYGPLPAVVAVAGLNRVDVDDGPVARVLILAITVAVCALVSAGQLIRRSTLGAP